MATDRGESRDLETESDWDDNEVLDDKYVKQKHGSQGYWAPDYAPKSKDWYAENVNGSGSQMSKAVIKKGCSNEVYGDLFQAIKTSAGKGPTFRRFNHNTPEYKAAATSAPSPIKPREEIILGMSQLSLN
ncbi:hypothetical protein K469DRAFT_689778 [Zopfia rhizophila CBS 207.26]|uniref:Uncharacterized protein n=1 Tax=Zopfia rhizophila CBS 207.26 TaxID=1314779 RepID=A0A6A6DX87_9PEZI|nr:hypothetical protein K469DRAFT_689778 [Zopfia rhizophila CBS 207.26]